MASLDQLRQLDPTGGTGFLARVLGTYAKSLERHEAEAQQARQAAQWDALARTAHTLKSASASVGALTFSQLCADIEGRIRRQELDQLDPLLDRFFEEAARVRDAVQAQLGAPRAADGGSPPEGGKGLGSGPSSLGGPAAS